MNHRPRISLSSTLFVTVGSTRFEALVCKVLEEKSLSQLTELGFTKLVIQFGSSNFNRELLARLRQRLSGTLDIELYAYKNSISGDIERADVIVGHAGAGTCLECLRAGKRLLIVTNDSLMGDHQSELAEQLEEEGYVVRTTVDRLGADLESICSNAIEFNKFPPSEPKKFEEIFDECVSRIISSL